MKKSIKIIIAICSVILIGVLIFGYQIYKFTRGSEEIVGNKGQIPSATDNIPPVTKGTADWPNWRGVNFDGKSTTTGIKTDWSKGLKKIWQIDYLCQGNSSATWSSPVIQGNRLIIMGRDNESDYIFCINAETSDLIWKASYKTEAESSHGEGARATPFIDNGLVYAFGRSGDLTCWNLEDGKFIWKQNVKNLGGIEPDWGFSTAPLIYEDKVIVQGGGDALVVAYNKLNGQLVWKSMQGEAGYAATIPVIVGNETELLVYHGKGLSLINPADGKEFWRVPWETNYCVNASTPIVDNDIIFHTSGYEMGGQALKFNKEGYKILWKNKTIGGQHTDPILINGYLYSYSGESSRKNGLFKCVELNTGKEMWSTDKIGQGTTTYVDGHLICMDITGNIYLVNPDPKSFHLVGSITKAMEDVKSPAWTLPVVANGKLYLRYLQHLVCYSL
jgi:outer membrane protein assembly factor BamB